MTVTATIEKTPKWDRFAGVERVQWTAWLSNGQRKITRTRRELVEWCAEMGYEVA